MVATLKKIQTKRKFLLCRETLKLLTFFSGYCETKFSKEEVNDEKSTRFRNFVRFFYNKHCFSCKGLIGVESV